MSLCRSARADLLGNDFALPVAEQALAVAVERRPCRIEDPIANRPQDGSVEGHEPPFGQRLVEFLNAVPFMPGGFDARDAVDFAIADGHCWLRSVSAASSSRASRCARSKRAPFDGRNA